MSAPPAARRPRSRRRTLVGAAIVGTTALALAASAGAAWSWRARREAARQALTEHLLYTTRAVGDELARMGAERRWALLTPVLGRRAEVLARDATLAAFEAHVTRTLEEWGLTRDRYRGVFRLTLAGDAGGALQVAAVRGALADARVRDAAAAAVRARLAQPGGADEGEPLLAFLTLEGRQVGNVVFTLARPEARGPTQLVGVVYDRALATRASVEAARFVLPPLPPALARGARGGDAVAAPAVRRLDDGWATDVGVGTMRRALESRTLSRDLGTRFLTRDGQVLYATDGWPAARWRTPYRVRVVYDSRPGGFALETAMDRAEGERLVRAAVAPAEPWAAGALAVLAALFAAASAVGLRRERQLERLRARFVASVSHELRTPLTQICVFSDMLLQEDGPPTPTTQRWLGIINREAHRLALMVESVLLTARDDAGGLQVARRPCDATEIAEDVRVAMQPLAAAREAAVRVVAPAECPVAVDPGALRQVLLNLVDNALKYGPEGQTVTVTLDAPGADGALVATVDDEGPGIAPAERARVWRPYERLERHDGVGGGSGLGLSVVRTLVAQHGGAVAIDDAPGGGARVRVAIPDAARPAARPALGGAIAGSS